MAMGLRPHRRPFYNDALQPSSQAPPWIDEGSREVEPNRPREPIATISSRNPPRRSAQKGDEADTPRVGLVAAGTSPSGQNASSGHAALVVAGASSSGPVPCPSPMI